MHWGVHGQHRGWLQAHIPDPDHPQLRCGTKSQTGAIRACLIMVHTKKDRREEEGAGVVFANWDSRCGHPKGSFKWPQVHQS